MVFVFYKTVADDVVRIENGNNIVQSFCDELTKEICSQSKKIDSMDNCQTIESLVSLNNSIYMAYSIAVRRKVRVITLWDSFRRLFCSPNWIVGSVHRASTLFSMEWRRHLLRKYVINHSTIFVEHFLTGTGHQFSIQFVYLALEHGSVFRSILTWDLTITMTTISIEISMDYVCIGTSKHVK